MPNLITGIIKRRQSFPATVRKKDVRMVREIPYCWVQINERGQETRDVVSYQKVGEARNQILP